MKMSRAVWQLGQAVRECGIALERAGARLSTDYSFNEPRECSLGACPPSAPPPPPPPHRSRRTGAADGGGRGIRRPRGAPLPDRARPRSCVTAAAGQPPRARVALDLRARCVAAAPRLPCSMCAARGQPCVRADSHARAHRHMGG